MCNRSLKISLSVMVTAGLLIAFGYYVYQMHGEVGALKKMFHASQQQVMKSIQQEVTKKTRVADVRDTGDQRPMSGTSWLSVQRKVKDTVVQVFANIAEFNWLEPYKTPKQGMSAGSGFFINSDGDIISNYHVVAQAVNVQIQIPSCGSERFDVEIVGVSPERDIALMRLPEHVREKITKKLSGIPSLTLGDSDEILRSHEILALGYPLGQTRLKSTLGIVSGRERLGYFGYIQVTTPLNPGNSGGPALNDKGEVVGINAAGVPGAQNVGYVIPINEVKNALEDLRNVKVLRKPLLGCIFTYSSPEMVSYLNNPAEGGWYIAKVFDNAPMKSIGVRDGDMLYEVDGHKIDMYGEFNVSWSEDKVSLFELLNRYNARDEIPITVYRKGVLHSFSLSIDPEKYLPAIRAVYPEFEPKMTDYENIGGLVVMSLTLNHLNALLQNCPDLIKYGRIDNQQKPALLITQIIPNSQAYESRILRPGEIIEEVNGVQVRTLQEFREAVIKSKHSGFITITTSENLCAVLSVDKILKEEAMLAGRYFYQQSSLLKQLV